MGWSTINAGWSDERVDLLKKLYAEGKLSYSQIAGELGGVSRNAVIGKVHRLGLERRGNRVASTRPRRSRAKATGFVFASVKQSPARTAMLQAQFAQAAEATECPPEPMDLTGRPTGAAEAVAALASESCRWPLGDPAKADFHFCGANRAEPFPYCGAHCYLAYTTPNERRRDNEHRKAA